MSKIYDYMKSTNESETKQETKPDWMLTLAWEMVKTYNAKGFLLAIITGLQGSGKSVYAFLNAYQYLKYIGILPPETDEAEGLEYVFYNHTFFIYTLEEAIKVRGLIDTKLMSFEELTQGVGPNNPLPVLIWDDAGVYGSNYIFWIDKKLTHKISSAIQLARRRTRVLILTTPNADMLLKVVRKIPERILVNIRIKSSKQSAANLYIYNYAGDKPYITKIGYDLFKRIVPDNFYKKYMDESDLWINAVNFMYEGHQTEKYIYTYLKYTQASLDDIKKALPRISEAEIKKALEKLVKTGKVSYENGLYMANE